MINDTTRTMMSKYCINNTFDLDTVDKTMKKTLENSFHYLYRMQRNLIVFQQFYFPSSKESDYETRTHINYGELYLDDYKRVCIMLDVDLVDQDKRDQFYNSNLYRNEFELEEINKQYDLFDKTILLAIDDSYIFDIKVKMVNGNMIIILPYKTDFLYDLSGNLIEHTTSVMIVENEEIRSLTTNRGVLSSISGNLDEVIITPMFVGVEQFREDGNYVVFINKPDSILYTFFATSTKLTDGNLRVDFSPYVKNMIGSYSTNFKIKIMFMKDLYVVQKTEEIGKINGNAPLVIIEKKPGISYNSPIPTENVLVLKKNPLNNDYVHRLDIHTRLKYPNVYTIVDSTMDDTSKYKVLYFYRRTPGVRYISKYDFWKKYILRKFSMNSLQEFYDKWHREGDAMFNTIFDSTKLQKFKGINNKILNYNSPQYMYNVIDYVKNPANAGKDPFEYKINTMVSMVKSDYNVLRDYVVNQNKISDTYRLFVRRIDLSKRLRRNTMGDIGRNIEFPEDRYLFIFTNIEGIKPLNIKIWVDGILCMNAHHEFYFGIDYIYIPTSMIKADSYMEIEINHSLEFENKIYFDDTNKWIEMDLDSGEEILPTLEDILIIKTEDNSIIDLNKFEIHMVYDNLLFNYDKDADTGYINQVSSYFPDTFDTKHLVDGVDTINTRSRSLSYIQPLSGSVENTDTKQVKYGKIKKIRIRAKADTETSTEFLFSIYKNAYYEQKNINSTSYPLFKLNKVKFNLREKEKHIRVWYNGRLVCPDMYKISESGGEGRVQLLFAVNKGDKVGLEITPYQNIEIFSSPSQTSMDPILPMNTFDKPFDLDYYDVFLNGRKLTEKNIFSVGKNEVKFYNCKSIHNLRIFQKERDDEVFGYGYPENAYDNYLSFQDIINENILTNNELIHMTADVVQAYIDKLAKTEDIHIGPNVKAEEDLCIEGLNLDDELIIKIFYYEELLPKIFTDPNTVQFVKDVIRVEYQDIYDTYMINDSAIAIAENAKVGIGGGSKFPTNVLFLDPNVNISTATTVYFVGKYDSVHD